jgi:subtilisin family serine protease
MFGFFVALLAQISAAPARDSGEVCQDTEVGRTILAAEADNLPFAIPGLSGEPTPFGPPPILGPSFTGTVLPGAVLPGALSPGVAGAGRAEVLVRLREGIPPREGARIVERLHARILRTSRRGDTLVIRISRGMERAALAGLEGEARVAFVEPYRRVGFGPLAAPPGASLDALQWAFQNRGDRPCFSRGVDINLPGAWEITTGREDVLIVVVDSGLDLDHPDLRGRLYPRGDEDWNFTSSGSKLPVDTTGHGTAVAGLAAAAAVNGVGVTGVAPGCRLMPLKIDGFDMVISFIDALEYAVDFAVRHPELRLVVNGSLKVPDTLAIHDAVSRAHDAGIVLCFSAGNEGGAIDTPAIYPQAIAVGAIGPDGSRKRRGGCGGGSWASAHGPELDLVAPGVQLVTTDLTGPPGFSAGDYNREFSGTSGACPIVAGVAALMLSANHRLTPDRVLAILEASAVDGDGDPAEDIPGFDEFMGWGRVNAARAVALASADWRPRAGPDLNTVFDFRSGRSILSVLTAMFGGKTPGFTSAREAGGGKNRPLIAGTNQATTVDGR